MTFRKTFASPAAAAALAIALVTAPAATAQKADTSADAFRQSAEPVALAWWDFYFSLFDNPVTAPSALGTSLSAMSLQYLIYCPIALELGLEERYSPRCTF
ncbi:hypothetical protein [Corynebacterium halotolerans]|uniref:Secreted protein n=1 Tax=Corynebacterium halotolerans YIM 70093 = DSM 44683 TaxID=1121362 RepID=M1NX64_9CORY|nr:hypothetical protein [Corynebacterium halotolerans]AGF72080.1 hypothetical protein A605_05370 [Corynebacterium halotolerans YIM 70093 = DSM 44683]